MYILSQFTQLDASMNMYNHSTQMMLRRMRLEKKSNLVMALAPRRMKTGYQSQTRTNHK